MGARGLQFRIASSVTRTDRKQLLLEALRTDRNELVLEALSSLVDSKRTIRKPANAKNTQISIDCCLDLRIPLMVQKQRKIRFEGTSSSSIVTGRIDGKLNTMAVGEINFIWLFEEFSGKSITSSIYVVINSLAAFSSPTLTAPPSILLLLNATSKLPLSYASMPFNYMTNALTTLPRAARRQLLSWRGIEGSDSAFKLSIPATIPVVKDLCGLDMVESYLQWTMSRQ
ncbi:Aldehyde oxidase 1 [Tripterygium wilfordii]|uniref:Aldehyde oxidase 1 n=1 Tax=Tripterygium wilfordii TaxID=458696 RepID=A0A7J7C089_TRIWF|nr:Aldehyde oxidase 1 [Tripterygium wilfordii]